MDSQDPALCTAMRSFGHRPPLLPELGGLARLCFLLNSAGLHKIEHSQHNHSEKFLDGIRCNGSPLAPPCHIIEKGALVSLHARQYIRDDKKPIRIRLRIESMSRLCLVCVSSVSRLCLVFVLSRLRLVSSSSTSHPPLIYVSSSSAS